MSNYYPFSSHKNKSSFSFFSIFYYLIIIIVIFIIVIYLQYYYKSYKNALNRLKNYESFTDDSEVLSNENYSPEICKKFTSNASIDDNFPEYGGIKCLIDFIKLFGENIEENIYELKYITGNKRYRLDENKKIINFHDENGILINNKFCMYLNKDNFGCVLN